jgi:hypothetical protein
VPRNGHGLARQRQQQLPLLGHGSPLRCLGSRAVGRGDTLWQRRARRMPPALQRSRDVALHVRARGRAASLFSEARACRRKVGGPRPGLRRLALQRGDGSTPIDGRCGSAQLARVDTSLWPGIDRGFRIVGATMHGAALPDRTKRWGGTTRPPNKELKLTKPSQNGASQLNSSVRRTDCGAMTLRVTRANAHES